MSGVILDADGHKIAGEARQQVAVPVEQQMMAPMSLGAATAQSQLLMALTNLAMDPKMPLERVDHIEKMFERARAYEAKSAYTKAMAKAKAEMPLILKSKHVGFKARKPGASDTSYNHEDLSDVTRVTDPILGKYGLISTFRVSNVDKIKVTCVIRHEDGHEDDSNTLTALKDDSGHKNDNQQVASTITYLKRYTLMAALGLAAVGEDDDGRGSEVAKNEPKITAEQVETIEKLIAALPNSHITRDTDGLIFQINKDRRWGQIETFEDLPASAYEDCLGRIANAKATRDKAADAAKARSEDDANKLRESALHAARTTTTGGQGRIA